MAERKTSKKNKYEKKSWMMMMLSQMVNIKTLKSMMIVECTQSRNTVKARSTQIYTVHFTMAAKCRWWPKNRKSSNQHAHQVFTIVQSLQQNKSPLKWWDADASREEISQLLDKTLIRDRFLTEYVNGKKCEPGTTKSYLGSLRHFMCTLFQKTFWTRM